MRATAYTRRPGRLVHGLATRKSRARRQRRLTRQELRELENQLLQKKRALTGDIELLCQEAAGAGPDLAGNGSGLAFDDPDLAVETAVAEMRAELVANEVSLLQEVEDALRRIDDRSYGLCMATGKPISKARLRAIPWTRYCAAYARERERKAVPLRPRPTALTAGASVNHRKYVV